MNSGYQYEERVPPRAGGMPVLDWLALRYPHSTAETWRTRIAAGEVRLDDTVCSPGDVLQTGQSLVWSRPPWTEAEVPLGFAVLFRDEHLLAVAKPRGLPTVPNGGFLEHTLLFRVRRLHPEAVPMHRLGRGTSGIVLFARTLAARRGVAAAWRMGSVLKEYRALVVGSPEQDAFSVQTPIGLVPHPRLGRVYAAVSAGGQRALSHVRVLARQQTTSLVSVTIATGRPHQIRIHLAAAGHPLVGDPLYVVGGVPGEDPALPGAGGYWLHACRLALVHPVSGAPLELTCAPPARLVG